MISQINTRFAALNEVADDFAFLRGQAILDTDVTKMAAVLALKYPNDPHEFSSEIESFKFQATTLMNDNYSKIISIC